VRGLANIYGVSLGLMGLGVAGAAASPNVWVAAVCVIVSGAGNGATIVCNALLVQRGAPDRFGGRAFTVLMSSNVTFLALGMVLAGRLTEAYGPRWVWGGRCDPLDRCRGGRLHARARCGGSATAGRRAASYTTARAGARHRGARRRAPAGGLAW
jgi:hypothetical protein